MDGSTKGWRAHLDDVTYQGTWTEEEFHLHINCLEMRAVKVALSRFHISPQSHVLVATDNTSVVAYISKVGRGQDFFPLGERQSHLQLSFVLIFQSVPGLYLAR